MSENIVQKLDEMQARCDAATEGPWTATFDDADRWTCITGQGRDLGGGLWMVCPEVATCEGEPDGDAEFIAAARTDMPRLIDALKAVLEEHHPEGADRACECCPQRCYCGHWEYPCPTAKAIAEALEVES